MPLVQHLLGLGVAGLLYAVLVRRGVPAWLAALAAAPVLLDAYHLSIEQYITPEPVFEVSSSPGALCFSGDPCPAS